MTKRSLFLFLALTLTLTLLLTACQKPQTTPTDRDNPSALSSQGENAKGAGTAPTAPDLPVTDSATDRSSAKEESAPSDRWITREAAKAAVLAHAGLTDATIRRIETELDGERGITVYEVEFEYGGYDYEYVLNAETGEILFHEKEMDRD